MILPALATLVKIVLGLIVVCGALVAVSLGGMYTVLWLLQKFA